MRRARGGCCRARATISWTAAVASGDAHLAATATAEPFAACVAIADHSEDAEQCERWDERWPAHASPHVAVDAAAPGTLRAARPTATPRVAAAALLAVVAAAAQRLVAPAGATAAHGAAAAPRGYEERAEQTHRSVGSTRAGVESSSGGAAAAEHGDAGSARTARAARAASKSAAAATVTVNATQIVGAAAAVVGETTGCAPDAAAGARAAARAAERRTSTWRALHDLAAAAPPPWSGTATGAEAVGDDSSTVAADATAWGEGLSLAAAAFASEATVGGEGGTGGDCAGTGAEAAGRVDCAPTAPVRSTAGRCAARLCEPPRCGPP